MSPPRAAARLHVSDRTIRRWVKRALGEANGNSPLLRSEVGIGPNGRYFVKRSAVQRLTPAFGTAVLL